MVKIASTKKAPTVIFVAEKNSPLFPSTRLFMAALLCLCFISLSVATSNISQSMVCMVISSSNRTDPMVTATKNDNSSTSSDTPCKKHSYNLVTNGDDDVSIMPCSQRNKFAWTSTQQGFVYAAQNIGSLFMLITGWQADRLNGKWTIAAALVLLVASNAMIPAVASTSVWLVFVFRIITGMGDALLFPSASSMITRWFPPKERPFALGFVTGGRQIGTLVILPAAGFLCEYHGRIGGWPSIFYLSSIVGTVILILWLLLSADKPSKHYCVSQKEEIYINRKIEEEKLGKRNSRPNPPWGAILRCRALYVAILALVCHEYPLVIMLQFLPKFFADVLGLSSSVNGLVSALPSVVLFVSKTLSSSLSSLLTARKPPLLGKTTSCKLFNFVGSLGLGICLAVTPLLGSVGNAAPAILVLCLANAFAGLHTPGVQTALVQLAPAYTGIVTGMSFFVVALFSIANKLLSSYILATGSTREWTIVFEISAVVALLPIVFFSLWGSADVQPWAQAVPKKDPDQHSNSSGSSTDSAIANLAKYSLYLSHDLSNS